MWYVLLCKSGVSYSCYLLLHMHHHFSQIRNCAETKILHDPNAAFIPAPAPPVVNNELPMSTPQEFTSGVSIPVSLPSSSLETSYSSAGSHGKTIVGYYASWQWYDRNKLAAPENMDFTKVQRVNFAFFQIDTQGNMWGTDAWGEFYFFSRIHTWTILFSFIA